MNRFLFITVALLALIISTASVSQVQNEGLANAVVVARQKNATLLQQYNWNCRTEITQEGKMQDLRIDLVTLGPDGKQQRSLLNDQPGKLPGGFLRHAVAEGQRKDLEKLVAGLGDLVSQYTLPSAGKMVGFLIGAQVQPMTTPDNKTVLQVNGSGVVVPGDTLAMTLSGTTLQPMSLQITTSYEGSPVTISATFYTMKTGLNEMQFATVEMPAKKVSVAIHNYDYVAKD